MANIIYKHDWVKLKREWLSGKHKNLVVFAKAHKIDYGYVKQIAAQDNWYKDLIARNELKNNEIVKKTLEAEIKSEVDRNTKHLLAYDQLFDKVIKIIPLFDKPSKKDVYPLSKASEVLERIQKGQRLGEGLDSDYQDTGEDNYGYELPSRVIASSFVDINRSINDNEFLEYVFCGGRGSTKSSYISLKIVELIINNPDTHAVIIRKVKDTLRSSVYAQMVWAISELKLDSSFKCTVSPMEIIYMPTGQKIYFRGADDEAKIKSIKAPFGYIGVLWYEELDNFNGDEQIRNITQSAIRGGDTAYIFKSFNPPITQANWANKYVLLQKDNRLVHKSTYLTVPAKWLGKPFLDEAEHLKEINEKAYLHEYMGEAVGTGGAVFENVSISEITDAEISQFDRLYYGNDFGWYPDPNHFAGCYYNAAQRKLYIFNEIRCNKTSNEAMAKLLEPWKNDLIVGDSAEPKSISDFRMWGFNMRSAEKGPGSIDYSIKWLQSLNEIVIDSRRCPHTAKEFLEYEYERNKNGEIITGYPDKNNHSIDAIRYALNFVWKRRGE